MSFNNSAGIAQMGKLLVHVAENGHSFEINCDGDTVVETVQRFLESVTGIQLNDQLLLCLDMKLEQQRPLSSYNLPSDDIELFLFNKARMRNNSLPPVPEVVQIVSIPDPPLPSSSNDSSHPLDDASDPALKALPSYERQFRYHFQFGHAVYSRTLAKMDICERLYREQRVQERALEIACSNLDHFYKMILQNYKDFDKFYSHQYRSHTKLLTNFGRDIEKLRSWKIIPALQTANRKCLLDFVKEENLKKIVEECSISHKQFETKVSEFKGEFGELKRNAEYLFSTKASSLLAELEVMIREHQRYTNEQRSIMQILSKDVNTVKKLVDDCVTNQLSSSLRPHDAVSALGPMYDSHDKSLPRMQACEEAISHLVDFCQNKKNEMNIFVHNYMQKIAYIQFFIKDVRFKFSVFQEALKRQSDQFEPLRVVHGIGTAYRACLAEVVRRKATMKLYVGMAGQLAEKLATKREDEVRRREEFLKVHSAYIPRDTLTAMGLFDIPNQCDVNITPFDTNLLDIDISDIDRYAPEHLAGFSSKIEKQGTPPPKALSSLSNDSSQQSVEVTIEGESDVEFPRKLDSLELLDDGSVLEIAGTSKIEVENAQLKAELASKIAQICSMNVEFDEEELDESKIGSFLKTAAEKTSEALNMKEEYEKHLHQMLKLKQMQCDSYEKRIEELEQRLSDRYNQERQLHVDEDPSKLTISAAIKTRDSTAIENIGLHETMDEISCVSSSTNVKSGLLPKQGKVVQEGLDDNMSDSSGILNQLDSSMVDPHRDEGESCDKDEKYTSLTDEAIALATSMAVSISQPGKASPPETDSKVNADLVSELQTALADKSDQLVEAESKLNVLKEEATKLARELEVSRKLLDESQLNCAHLENCLHEAREEAQTHLCAADRRASQYSSLRASAVKMRSLFERLRSCVSSGTVVTIAESLRALAQSLANSISENEEDGAVEFRECIQALADKVSILSRHRAELLERYSKAEASNEKLSKELEEKKELVNTLYMKHQLEKQANKEKISFGKLEVHEIGAFVLNSGGHYEAINRNFSHYYLSAESVALFTAEHLPDRLPPFIVGQIVHIERQTVRSPVPRSSTLPSTTNERNNNNNRDQVSILTSSSSSSSDTGGGGGCAVAAASLNPYGLPVGCEYFVVTVAMLPDTTIHSPPSS